MPKSQAKGTQQPVNLTLTQAYRWVVDVRKVGTSYRDKESSPGAREEFQALKKRRAGHKMEGSLEVLIQCFKN